MRNLIEKLTSIYHFELKPYSTQDERLLYKMLLAPWQT